MFYNKIDIFNKSSIGNSGWFVLQVAVGREMYFKNLIENHVKKDIKVIVFLKEVIRKRKDFEKSIIHPIFPGYLFIYKEIGTVIRRFRELGITYFYNRLCLKRKKCCTCYSANSACMILPEEMAFLFSKCDAKNIFRPSTYYTKNNDIVFVDGPLKNCTKNILWVNPKKGIAKVRVKMFNYEKEISLGLKHLHSAKTKDLIINNVS